MFFPLPEGPIEIEDQATGEIVGYGFMWREGTGNVQQQRWILYPDYKSPPKARVRFRRANALASTATTLREWVSLADAELFREDMRWVDVICVSQDEPPGPSDRRQINFGPVELMRDTFVIGSACGILAPDEKTSVEYWHLSAAHTRGAEPDMLVQAHRNGDMTLSKYIERVRSEWVPGDALAKCDCEYWDARPVEW